MINFHRRLFPERRYRLPRQWTIWLLWAGLLFLLFWIIRVWWK
ncbi:MAG: hypothetical protein ACP5JB_05650 [candidate division WOR-3 bacterium]|jgi:hypothetical protein